MSAPWFRPSSADRITSSSPLALLGGLAGRAGCRHPAGDPGPSRLPRSRPAPSIAATRAPRSEATPRTRPPPGTAEPPRKTQAQAAPQRSRPRQPKPPAFPGYGGWSAARRDAPGRETRTDRRRRPAQRPSANHAGPLGPRSLSAPAHSGGAGRADRGGRSSRDRSPACAPAPERPAAPPETSSIDDHPADQASRRT
jgi:hypothetical protein